MALFPRRMPAHCRCLLLAVAGSARTLLRQAAGVVDRRSLHKRRWCKGMFPRVRRLSWRDSQAFTRLIQGGLRKALVAQPRASAVVLRPSSPRCARPGSTGTEHYSRCSRLRDECFPQATLNKASELLRISPRQTPDPGKHSFAPTALMKAATINNAGSLTE